MLAFKLQSTGSRQPTDYLQLFGENKPVGRRLVFAVSGSAIPGENSKDSATGGGEGMKEREKKKGKVLTQADAFCYLSQTLGFRAGFDFSLEPA